MFPLGIRIYGLGALATGLVGLAWGDFALQWEPVTAHFPARTPLAYLFAALLVAAGAAINWRRSASLAAALLSILYAVVVIFMHGANIAQHPTEFVAWDGAAEQLALLAGGVTAYAILSGGPRASLLIRAASIAMGLCLVMFGLAHFFYLEFTASMVPTWIPGRQTFWALLTGVSHLAAGLALLSGIQARLAACLLTVMFAIFSVFVHLPLLIAHPAQLSWVMNAINLSLTGAAWSIAIGTTWPVADAPARGDTAQARAVTLRD